MVEAPTLSVIVVNFNTPDLVRGCLASLRAELKVPYEVIVVDNGSERPVAEADRPATYVPLPKNLGFGAANNRGAAKATGDFLLLLNSDAELPRDNGFGELIISLRGHPDRGAVSPLLFTDRECTVLQHGIIGRLPSFGTLLRRNKYLQPDRTADFIRAGSATAAALVLPRQIFEELGGFDERFFMYFEDDDLCARIGAAGYQVGLFPAARAVHLQGRSISVERRRKRLYYVSQTYYWRKHYGAAAALAVRLLRLPLRIAKG